MRYVSKFNFVFITGLLNSVGFGQLVWAQDLPVTPLEEIIVTASKRAENAQSVPISINHYNGDSLLGSGLNDIQNLQLLDPSLIFTTNTAFGQPFLRGVGSEIFSPGAEASVAVFVDDVYQSRSVSANQELFDVEQVSVVKGPQGALFGRNAVGGAINIRNKKPSDDTEAELGLSYGNFNALRIDGAINSPIIEQTLNLRLSGLYNKRGGFSENIQTGNGVNDADLMALRVQADWNISANASLLISGHYSTEDSTRNIVPRVNVDTGLSIADLFGAVRPEDTFQLAHNDDGSLNLDSIGVSANLKIDLGNVLLRSISGYRETDLELAVDLDASSLPFANSDGRQISDSFTQEIQLLSNREDKFEWVVGGFYLHEDASQGVNNRLNFPVGPPNILDQVGGNVVTDSFGLFGNLKYDLTDKLIGQVGLRYNTDKRVLDFSQTTTLFDLPLTIPAANQDEQSFDAFTPRFVLEYKPSDQNLLYASVSRGYKAGGFNTNVNQAPFDPESLWAYEIGYKNTLWNDRARLNAAAFVYGYSGLQLLTLPPGAPAGTLQSVINAAAASIKGLEGEIVFVATDNFIVNVSAAFLDAEFKDFVSTNPNAPDLGEVDRRGARLPRAPEIGLNAGLQFATNFLDRDLIFHTDFRYESAQFLDIFQDSSVRRDDNISLNSHITYQVIDDASLNFWVRNVTNEETVASALRVDGLFGTLEYFLPPRTYGISLNLKF